MALEENASAALLLLRLWEYKTIANAQELSFDKTKKKNDVFFRRSLLFSPDFYN